MSSSQLSPKMATQLPKLNLILSKTQKVNKDSTETDTKTSKNREPSQKYRIGTISNIKYSGGGGGRERERERERELNGFNRCPT